MLQLHSCSRWFVVSICSLVTLYSGAYAQTIDVCPNNPWKDLPLVKKPTPYDKFGNPFNWTGGQVKTYVEKELAPKAAGNIALLIMVLTMLLVFVLWRLIRGCTVLGCCRARCDSKRAMHDPFMILTSKHVLYVKVFMILLGLAAIAWTIVGMVRLDPGIVTQAFDTTYGLLDYADGVVDDVDGVVRTARTMDGNLDGISAVVYTYANFTALKANLQCVDNFLTNGYGNLQAQLNTVKADLDNAPAGIDNTNVDQFTGEASQLAGAGVTIGGGPTLLNNIGSGSTSFSNAVAALPGTANPGASDPNVVAYGSALTTYSNQLSTWSTNVDDLNNAINTLETNFASPPETLKPAYWASYIDKVNKTLIDVRVLQANLPGLLCMTALAAQMSVVNTTLVGFTGQAATSYSTFADAVNNLTAPANGESFDNIISDLNTFSALNSSFLSDFSTIVNGPLTTAYNALLGRGSNSNIQSNLANLQSLIPALQSDVSTAQGSYNAYVAGPTAALYTTLKNDAATAKTDADGATTAASSANSANPGYFTSAATMATSLNQVVPQVNALKPTITAANNVMNSMIGYFTDFITDNTNQMFATLPPAGAAGLVDPILSQVDTLQDTINSTIASTKSELDSVLNNFASGTVDIRKKLSDARKSVTTYNSDGKKIDKYRYDAIMGIFGGTILVILLIVFFTWLNTQAGITWTAILLALLLLVFFLVSSLLAFTLVTLRDGCQYTETVVIAEISGKSGSSSKTDVLINYYLGGPSNASVQSVLKGADIIDIQSVEDEINQARFDVVADIEQNFIIRPTLLGEISNLNITISNTLTAINAVLAQASYSAVVGQYSDVKSYVCCTVAQEFGQMWETLTYGGFIAMWLLVLAAYHLARLDDLPRTDCCGCTCHHPEDFVGTGVPPVTVSPLAGTGHGYNTYPGKVGSHTDALPAVADSKYEEDGYAYRPPQHQEVDMGGYGGKGYGSQQYGGGQQDGYGNNQGYRY